MNSFEKKSALLSTAYFPPVQYFSTIISHPEFQIEKWEHYEKQSYRNRCNIGSSLGVLSLSIPVCHNNKEKISVKDLKISYDFPWQKNHWKSILSVYKNSPFFEFYEEEIKKLILSNQVFLLDFNSLILENLFTIFKIKKSISFTEEFQNHFDENVTDFRSIIHPKVNKTSIDNAFKPTEYLQVFSDKTGFIPDLSILDLLFNEGENALSYLKNSTKS